MNPATTIPQLAPGVRLSQDPISGEPLLLYPEGFVILNPTAFEVVSRCDGCASLEQIVAALAEEYDAPAETLHPEVWSCLQELQQMLVVHLSPRP